MIWKIIIVLAASIASYFIPTPQELQNAFIGGQNFYASGNFRKAIEQYDYIINTKSDFLDEDSVKVELLSGEFVVSVVVAAYYQKANALKNLGNRSAAVEIFRIVEARYDEPKLAALAQFQIYDIFYRNENYDSAIVEARKLVVKYPNDKKAETALYDIGWSYRELNDLENSNKAFAELIQRYPETDYLPRAIYQLGQNNFDQKDFDEAIVHWTDLNERFKPEAFKQQDWENVQLKAVKERQIFEATAGRETDETVLELVAKAQVKIGDALKEKGKFYEAINSYNKVVITYKLLPKLVEVAYIKMADYTLRERGIDSARVVYQHAVDENFANKELQAKMQYKIAEMYQNQDYFDRAAKEYEFYIRAYADVANAIEFEVDKAQFSIVAMYYNAKKYQLAVDWADSLIKKYPYSDALPGALLLKGLSLNSLERYEEAREMFTKILDEHEDSPDIGNAKAQIGFTHFQEKQYEKALENYLEALARYPDKIDSSQVYFDLINVYFELNRLDEAIAAFEYVKFGSPYYPAAFGKLTKIYGARSEYDKGVQFLNGILERSKGVDSVYYLPDINFAFADLYISQNDYPTAVDHLTKVINDTTSDETKMVIKLQARYARGVLYYQLENYKASISDLEFVKDDEEFKSRFANYETNVSEKLALAYSKTGKVSEALEMISMMIEAALDETEKGNLYAIISNVYYESRNYQKAVESAKNVIALAGISEETKVGSYITLSQSYKALKQLNKSAEVLLEASEKYPASSEIPAVLYSLAALYFDEGDYEKASDIFNKFIARYPDNPNVKEARYFRAYAYFESGDWLQAYNSFKQFASAYPQDPLAPETQFFAAEATFNSKDFNKAISEYRIVYQRYPNNDFAPQALYNEAWCYFELEQPEKMIETFKRLAQRYPSSNFAGDGLFTIGDYYYNIKDYMQAAEAYTELITKFPDYEKAREAEELLYDLSQINSFLEYEQAMKFFDARNYQKTIEELTRLLEKYPDASISVGCQVNIAASYEMLENYRKAAEWYKKILEKYSASKDDNERSAVIFAKEHLEWIEENYF
jgi:tetratricopeptide (TPR) repeat protein